MSHDRMIRMVVVGAALALAGCVATAPEREGQTAIGPKPIEVMGQAFLDGKTFEEARKAALEDAQKQLDEFSSTVHTSSVQKIRFGELTEDCTIQFTSGTISRVERLKDERTDRLHIVKLRATVTEREAEKALGRDAMKKISCRSGERPLPPVEVAGIQTQSPPKDVVTSEGPPTVKFGGSTSNWAGMTGVTQAQVWRMLMAPDEGEKALYREAAKPDMVHIKRGCFDMGSPRSERGRYDDEVRHQVCVEKDFWIGKYEVTFEQWEACVSGGGCGEHRPDDEGWGRGERPVINVSWNDAMAFARWLSGGESGKTYRLPSEEEWEYAARAGSTRAYPWGDTVSPGLANCDGCGDAWGGNQTAPVDRFDANKWGLHNTVGNVLEWTCSRYDEDYSREENYDNSPCAASRDEWRVARGGSWFHLPKDARSATRYWFSADIRVPVLGFRLVHD